MSYLKSVLKEEQQRLLSLSERYRDQLGGLPRGCVSIKNRKGLQYLYLASRKSGKVCFEYMGPLSSEQARDILKKIEQRNKLKEKLKQVKKDLRELEKALSGIQRTSA
jgi:hypothetical protein